ncbi:MAG: hypothetical protein ACREMA_00585 [Longimicrobiales bacterium]
MDLLTSRQPSRLAQIVSEDSGVAAVYRHYDKQSTPGDAVETDGAVLKWYDLHAPDSAVPAAINALAREHLAAVQLDARGLGFVILHRCGRDFYFLIVSTWRGSNELWQTVFYKDGDAMADFALFSRENDHKPTFCVWELVPVWHEQQAWRRFLTSARDEAAAQLWLRDLYSGPA